MKSLPIEPSLEPIQLGARIRNARLRKRLTIEQVADHSGLSKGFLSRVEREVTSPSVATLMKICQVLGVTPGSLLDKPDTTVVPLAEAPQVFLGGDGITERLLTPPSQRGLQIIHATIAAGGRGEDELYTVDCCIESLHVLSGRVVLRTSSQEFDLTAGSTATFQGDEPHSWYNPSEETSTVLWILQGATS